jgi:hypothetical protein
LGLGFWPRDDRKKGPVWGGKSAKDWALFYLTIEGGRLGVEKGFGVADHRLNKATKGLQAGF